MARKNEVRFREFLNTLENGGSAYVKFEVIHQRNGVSAEFRIKDCSRYEATLDFCVYGVGAKDTANALAKLATLKRAITEFEQAYLAALDKHKARLAGRKAKKKKARAGR